ncbi:hypothetical protein [Sporolactobacillus shoreicorticis]|uniref:Uncharacterized protein n=1 Tax=Sporolactobacillus shoreicorticis TaxID=1923877 RepID=A0ABW5S0L2_9BACL|nr:hypothetical protein [Sporolactobacillus shoreicorticis]
MDDYIAQLWRADEANKKSYGSIQRRGRSFIFIRRFIINGYF